jgi:hypothetical protein
MSTVIPDADSSVGREDGSAIDPDEAFHVLRNRRRRFALHTLKYRDGPVELGEMAEQVAAWEYDVPREALTSQQRKRVYNSLQQTHVPELEDTGLVNYHRGTAELTDRADELDVYLEVVSDRDIPWSRYYLALGAVCTALVAAAWIGAPGIAALSGNGVAAFVSVAFTVSATAHVLTQRQDRVGRTAVPPEVQRD